MQALMHDTGTEVILYRNRPYSPAFNSPPREPLCDVIYLVQPDAQLRNELCSFFKALGTKVIAFCSASEYLSYSGRDTAACLIVDTELPDSTGFELQQRLKAKGDPPVIFVSNHSDVTSSVRAMKAGAIEFLTKPLDLQALVAAVLAAFVQDRRQRRRLAEISELQALFNLLTPREREVLPLVVGGLLNKQSASLLGISEVTLQIHRSQIMKKTRAESFADLVRMSMKLRIPHWREPRTPNPAGLLAVLPSREAAGNASAGRAAR